MTLDIITRRVNYQGDSRTTCFPFPFKVWGEEQVVVYCSDPATPWTETDITRRTTITLNEDNCGGAVVFSNPPASGVNLAVVREGDFLQEDEYISGSRFDAHEVEDRFDEDCAERQELLDGIARSIKVPNSSTLTPEEVYQTLMESVIYIQNALDSLTALYNEAVFYYNLAIGMLSEITYVKSREVSFVVNESHVLGEEGEWICPIPEGFKYYPKTNQLLVTIDGLALIPQTHFVEIGNFGEESNQIQFKINVYQGQQVYIKAMFLGTEEFEIKLQAMDDKIKKATTSFEDLLNTTKTELEEKKTSAEELFEGFTQKFEETEQLLKETEQLLEKAGGAGGTSTPSSYTPPTQGYCNLDQDYCGGCCVLLPPNVCYCKDTNTLHVAVDGLVLSPKYFEEIEGESGASATCIKLRENVCLYTGQELHAWTDAYWSSTDSDSEDDINTQERKENDDSEK